MKKATSSYQIKESSDNLMSLTGFEYQSDLILSDKESLQSQAQSHLTAGKQKLEAEIKRLEGLEKTLLKILHCNSIAQVNAKIQRYNSADNLSGLNLRKAFLTGMGGAVLVDPNALLKAMQQEIGKMDNEEIIDTEETKKAILTLMNQLRGGRRLTKEITIEVKGSKKKGNNFIRFSSLSAAQKDLVKQLSQKYKNLSIIRNANTEIIQAEEGADLKVNWGDVTQHMTPTEARKFFENNPSGLKEVNAKITTEILRQCGNDSLIKEIINHILSKDSYVFFVGNNEKDITGLLGEIKGMYYLASLVGREAISKDMLTWEGGTHTGDNNTKPHRDIILEGLGIQVKNTASDKNYLTSSFTEASIDTFLDSAGVPVDFRNLFRNYYGVLSFNVPFHIGREGKAVADYSSAAYSQDSVSRHKSMYSKLKEANNEITKSLAIYASSLMYINADEISKKEISKTDKNVLYFVAGKHFMLASQILKDIKSQIEKVDHPKSFQVKASNKTNIISAYNSQISSYTVEQAANGVTLTSSYTFKVPH